MLGDVEPSLAGLRDNLFYVIVFGPGFGESIVLRVPPDCWIVVDGCRAGACSYPARCLEEHDAAWSCVVLTHPHEDHMLGLDAVLDRPGGPVIGCVAPVVDDPRRWSRSPDPERHLVAGTKEHVLAVIQDRWERDPEARWELRRGEYRTFCGAVFKVLHPDDPTLRSFSSAVSTGSSFDPNLLSTPLLVEWREARLLLGADLPNPGWDSVAAEFSHLHIHHVLKAPHHGSHEALSPVYLGTDHSDRRRFWVVTPYNKRWKLPAFGEGEGIDRMLEHVDVVHLTGLPLSLDLQAASTFRTTRAAVMKMLTETAVGTAAGAATVEAMGTEDLRCWVAAGLDEQGDLVDVRGGPGSVVVYP